MANQVSIISDSTGTVGALYDNAMADSVNGAYKAELIRIRSPFQTVKALEQATLKWVSWWNTKRVHEALGYKTPAQVEQEFYQEQKTGKLTITIRTKNKPYHHDSSNL